MPNVIDLFAGVGGLSLGAARAGFKISLAVDNEPIFLNTHIKNFPKVKHLKADIGTLSCEELLKKAKLKQGGLDGLIGGPPCQGFSHMGRRDEKDERNKLFNAFFKLAAELKPKFWVAENVLGIENPRYQFILNSAFDLVKNDYTLLKPIKINASDYGVPTTRTRIFYVGYKPEFFREFDETSFLPTNHIGPVTVKEALEGLPIRIRSRWNTAKNGWQRVVSSTKNTFFAERLHNRIPRGVGDQNAIRRLQIEKKVSGCISTLHSDEIVSRYATVPPGGRDKPLKAPRLREDGFCPTLRAGTGSDKGSYQAIRPIHYQENRVITPREAARLQGFPDWFVFHDTKWHSFRQIGNSVSPLIAEQLLKVIFDHILT